MLLAIDVGNTNTVFAAFDDQGHDKGAMIDSWRVMTEPGRSTDEYAVFLSGVFALAGISFKDVSDILVSSVVPEVRFSLVGFCEKHLGITPVFVDKDMVGVEIDIERPDDVGADRLVNAVAVRAEGIALPAVVIDFGTATTFDVIDASGAYAGGVIAPGINLSLNALHSAASKLPKVSVKKVDRAIGKTTVQAMQAGLYLGYKGLIEGIIADITTELGHAPHVLATGGLAGLFAENIECIHGVDEDLTLKGLHEIYKEMKDEH